MRLHAAAIVGIAGCLAGMLLASEPAVKVYVEEPGSYQVTFEELKSAGLEAEPLASAGLGLTCGGNSVPIRVDDGGDGVFGPGDRIEFVGQRLHGDGSYFHEHSRYNVYFLHTDLPDAPRRTTGPTAEEMAGMRRDAQHFEEDLLRIRLRPVQPGEAEELWYWAKLVFNAREPFVQTFDLDDLGSSEGRPAVVRVHFRGWSKPRSKSDPEMADHRVDVALNGAPLQTAEWNDARPYLLEVPVPSTRLVRGANQLELRVPRRRPEDGGEEIIDVVLLNSIEIDYPRDPTIATGPIPLLAPVAVVADRPSRLRDPDHRADYVMIAHRTLLDAVRPLAEFHRSRGLAVEVADLQDVYDEFNHGVAHPRAIRDFLKHAYETWQRPPRFVLLVGDASWDAHNAEADDDNYADWTYRPREKGRFGKNTSTPYDEDAHFNRRGLVPTWNHATYQGPAASDNFFVDVDDDLLPEMAIGRLPVVKPEEVTRIVAKVRRYVTASEVGPWRRNVLLITNEQRRFQRQSDKLARRLTNGGFIGTKVYPTSSEVSNEHHTGRLVEAFDQGQLVVHFLGHGGRYIWRTGPPDLKKNHDLFTLDHLEQLSAGGPLPVVLSLTCYSAPFDHPNADSIGEKLLRLDERGAIAVVAASWRNQPVLLWSEALLDELTRPGATVGEALKAAKRRVNATIFTATYNLLGDPAVPVARPAGHVEVGARFSDPSPTLQVRGTVELDAFTGNIVVEAVDKRGDAVASATLMTDAPAFALDLDLGSADPATVHAVRVYAWSRSRNVDATGAVELVPAPPSAAQRAAWRAERRRQRKANTQRP